MARVVFQDGVHCPNGLVTIEPDDPGLLQGFTCFETLRTYGGRVHGLEEHLARLAASARRMRIPLPDGLAGEIEQALAARGGGEAAIRITLTRRHRVVVVSDLPSRPGSVRCATRTWEPSPWLPGWVKHGSRAAGVLLVEDLGVDEVIWVDSDGLVLEGTRSNVFAVRDGVLVTPPLDGRILAGVTRGLLLELLPEAHEVPFRLDDGLEELYLTSTLKELCPIVELDGAPARGEGPVGTALLRTFRDRVGSR
jgi:branched-chain amino acid aminotransferase